MRLIVWRQDGDIVIGAHVRDLEAENTAAVEAARLWKAKKEPPKPRMKLPFIKEGDRRDAFDWEVQQYIRWRTFQIWHAMRAAFSPGRKVKAVLP